MHDWFKHRRPNLWLLALTVAPALLGYLLARWIFHVDADQGRLVMQVVAALAAFVGVKTMVIQDSPKTSPGRTWFLLWGSSLAMNFFLQGLIVEEGAFKSFAHGASAVVTSWLFLEEYLGYPRRKGSKAPAKGSRETFLRFRLEELDEELARPVEERRQVQRELEYIEQKKGNRA